MEDDDLVPLAEKVATLLQLDRMRHRVGTEVDMRPLTGVSTYLTEVFERSGEIPPDATPAEIYAAMNRRIAQVQAQIYLLRLEMETRSETDPTRILADPMVVAAYGDRIESGVKTPKDYDFSSVILAHGWHGVERGGDGWHRWMRPVDGPAVACLPHLGPVPQELEIHGYVLDKDQLPTLSIRSTDREAEIVPNETAPHRFVAKVRPPEDVLSASSHVVLEFRIGEWRMPGGGDSRMLGANISRFAFRPLETASE
ncbi:hypothetical protein [Jannaschia aquimarina]|uniref:Uncharacterized protein n=1 Tax=Jannaschia aquimarina TaxID=935700 RepID=A0A0D1D533_9RHOB|nr:hypothetical protein [Jannaschia aquimarina]KIT15143.1 hypothetical protein jaqu_34710 [Jannaschia aquimarina]SNS65287.1 hypothetical protein SAMN05421775_101797 [Jannaschia aquimarina]